MFFFNTRKDASFKILLNNIHMTNNNVISEKMFVSNDLMLKIFNTFHSVNTTNKVSGENRQS